MDAPICREATQFVQLILLTVTSALFVLVNIVLKSATAADSPSPKIRAKAKAKAKDAERGRIKDAAKVKAKDVEDGPSDRRLLGYGTVLPKVAVKEY